MEVRWEMAAVRQAQSICQPEFEQGQGFLGTLFRVFLSQSKKGTLQEWVNRSLKLE